MAKRRAEEQIRKGEPLDNDYSSEEEDNANVKAAPSVLAQRKIAVPRTRSNKTDGFRQPNSSNPFSGFAQSSSAAPASSNPFGFLGKPAAPASQPTFGSSAPTTTNLSSGSNAPSRDPKELKIRALNLQFAAQIAKANTDSPFEDWTQMCEKYVAYSKKIADESGSKSFASVKNEEPANPQEPAKSQITSTGFKFADPNVNNASSFKFGDKNVDMTKTHSSKPSGGFVFNPNGSGEIRSAPAEEPKAPAFSFGAKTESSEKPAPAAGASTGFSFKPSSDATTKPGQFSFGSSSNPTASDSTASDSKPAFTFGQSTQAPAKVAETGSKPLFSFGGSASASSEKSSSDSAAKPAFTFGNIGSGNNSSSSTSFTNNNTNNGSSSGAAPKFSFGPSAQNSNTAFTFGTGSNPFSSKPTDDKKTDVSWKPSQPIKITTEDKPAESSNQNGDNNNDPSEEQNDPQADLGGPGPGEENENSVYEKRSKIFESVDGEYKTLGLGNLRLLVHRDTKKARALVRAEGSGRVLLNVPIRKEFEYTVVGKGQVRVLDVKPGSAAPTTYILRVKTEEDGNELKDKLQSIKN